MRLLVTAARMPFAVALIRRLAEAGHTLYACDTYANAPGSHSRYVAEHFVTASPRREPERFAEQVSEMAREHSIDLVIPSWEDVFYLAAVPPAGVRVYGASFESLARLHDKATFQSLAEELGVRAPATVVARSREELQAGIARFPSYFARAAFSRGGVSLLTNQGPLAGEMSPDDVEPTPDSPWLVQEFVDGPMICTYSTVHEGRVTAHCTYRAPRQWHHSTGIQFESVDGAESLAIVERLASALGYTGQISFDFVATADGLMIIECNPRTTDGVLLMSADELAAGMLDPDAEQFVVPAGRLVQLDFAVFAEMFSEGVKGIPSGIEDLLKVHGADRGWHDLVPNLYSFLALVHHERMSLKEHQKLMVVMSEDVCWNGEPIAGRTAPS